MSKTRRRRTSGICSKYSWWVWSESQAQEHFGIIRLI